MKLRLACLFFALLSIGAIAQSIEHPNHNIAVYDLDKSRSGYRLSRARIIASSEGYDNQPSFSHDSKSVYFTRIEGDNADLWLWHEDQNSKRLVSTTLSEYSPTPVPEKHDLISTVRVEAGDRQRLWSYSRAEGFRLLFNEIEPVGYHAWSGENIAMFVLGEPHQLRVTKIGAAGSDLVDSNIGRCLQKRPGENAVSYTSANGELHTLKSYDFGKKKISTFRRLPTGTQDYVWLDSKTILTSNGSSLWLGNAKGRNIWQKLEVLGGPNLNSISRLAISPDGKKLAVVYIQDETWFQ